MSRLYMSLWHPRLPRKILTMLWLISTKGFLVEAWRTHIGLPRSCKLCQMGHLEDSKHLFWKCNKVAEVWKKIQSLRDLVGFRTWDQILWGKVSLPNSWSNQVTTITYHEQNNTTSTEFHGRSLRLTAFGTLGVKGVNMIVGMKVFM